MTEFITRSYHNEYWEVIIQTRDKAKYEAAEEFARRLIGHAKPTNTISLPCKVDDKIYYLFQYSNKRILPFVRTAMVRKIYCTNKKMQFFVEAELLDAKEKGILKSFSIEEFNKTVFLSKKDAEAALRRGAVNGID